MTTRRWPPPRRCATTASPRCTWHRSAMKPMRVRSVEESNIRCCVMSSAQAVAREAGRYRSGDGGDPGDSTGTGARAAEWPTLATPGAQLLTRSPMVHVNSRGATTLHLVLLTWDRKSRLVLELCLSGPESSHRRGKGGSGTVGPWCAGLLHHQTVGPQGINKVPGTAHGFGGQTTPCELEDVEISICSARPDQTSTYTGRRHVWYT